MYREITAKVHKETKDGTYFYVLVPRESLTDEASKLSTSGIFKGELRLDDSRHISAEQRKKAYAMLADIAVYLGYPPEELKEIMKYRFVSKSDERYFSFSDCTVSTARHFISYLIDFALEWGIPLMDALIDRTDDINAAIYSSLKHKRCIICGQKGDIHHWDVIGMGHNRSTFDDRYLRKLCLCRIHHNEAHEIGCDSFEQKYHIYGIIFQE